MNSKESVLDALRQILNSTPSGKQGWLRQQLENHGFAVTQSTVSRLLRKLGAIKVTQPNGDAVYKLPQDFAPAHTIDSIAHLVTHIRHNQSLIVIHTNPGAAQLVAHILDTYQPIESLGTLAGDDCIFIVAPAG